MEKVAQFKENFDIHLASVNEKFDSLKEFIELVQQGAITGFILGGAAGIGKTTTIQDVLMEVCNKAKRELFNQDQSNHYNPDNPPGEEFKPSKKVVGFTDYYIVKGHITPMQLYITLMNNPDSIIVFDDCDSVFGSKEALNVLKAATDTTPVRIVSWESSKGDMPNNFEFRGAIIIVTNERLGRNPHFRALVDRMHIFDMLVTTEEKVARIYSVAETNRFVDKDKGMEICDWLVGQGEFIDYLSIRTFVKIAQLASKSPRWQRLAEVTILNAEKENLA